MEDGQAPDFGFTRSDMDQDANMVWELLCKRRALSGNSGRPTQWPTISVGQPSVS